MTPEAQRIAIAEACGWRNIRHEQVEDVDIDARSVSIFSGLRGVPKNFIHDENRVWLRDCRERRGLEVVGR